MRCRGAQEVGGCAEPPDSSPNPESSTGASGAGTGSGGLCRSRYPRTGEGAALAGQAGPEAQTHTDAGHLLSFTPSLPMERSSDASIDGQTVLPVTKPRKHRGGGSSTPRRAELRLRATPTEVA